MLVLKTLLFLRYTKASPLPSCSEPGMTEVNQVAQSLYALCQCAGLLYFYVSGHANVLHSLYRATDEADEPVLSQVFLTFFLFLHMGMTFAFFFSQLLETSQGHNTFSKSNRPQVGCVICQLLQHP